MKRENEVRDSSKMKRYFLQHLWVGRIVYSKFYHRIKLQGFSLDQRDYFQSMGVTGHSNGYQRFTEHPLALFKYGPK